MKTKMCLLMSLVCLGAAENKVLPPQTILLNREFSLVNSWIRDA